MSDKTTTGVWTDSTGVTSININAAYSLDGGTLAIAATGTATSTVTGPSPYTLICSGTLGSATGTGTYSISFSAWHSSDSGAWVVARQ